MSSATCMPHSSPQLFGEGAWELEGGGWRVEGKRRGGGRREEGGGRKESGWGGGYPLFPKNFFEIYTLYVALAKTLLVVLHFSPSFPSPKSNQLTDRRDVQDCHQRLSSAIVSVPDPKPTLAWIAFSIAHGGYTGSDTCAR